MADHLSEEEQLQALKNWWKENGSSIVTAVLLGLIAYFGFQWWQNHQQQQAEKASALYGELLEITEVNNGEALSEDNETTASYLIQQLKDEHSGSQYAVNAALYAAKIAVDKNNLDEAETALIWAVDNANSYIEPLAKLRLARVYTSKEKYTEALSLVEGEVQEAFTSLYAELKGDILLAQNDVSGARSAYEKALETIDASSSFRQRLLPIKIANLPTEDS